jgi:hypothetical protein
VFLDLGASLDATARGLERGDVEEARAGLEHARGLDDEIERLYERDRHRPGHRYQPPTGAHTTNRASTATPCISSTSPCATRETARHAPALLEAQHADLATDMLVGRSRSQAAT